MAKSQRNNGSNRWKPWSHLVEKNGIPEAGATIKTQGWFINNDDIYNDNDDNNNKDNNNDCINGK